MKNSDLVTSRVEKSFQEVSSKTVQEMQKQFFFEEYIFFSHNIGQYI